MSRKAPLVSKPRRAENSDPLASCDLCGERLKRYAYILHDHTACSKEHVVELVLSDELDEEHERKLVLENETLAEDISNGRFAFL